MEIEAKFIIQDTQTYRDLQIMEHLGVFAISAARVVDMRDTYLDTPDRQLLRSGYACRQREQDGCAVISLKSLHGVEGAIHRREEIEAPLARIEIPPEQWPDSVARQRALASIDPHMQLQPLVHLEQHRLVRDVRHTQRIVAELSLDTVKLARTGDQHVYHGLEIELKGAGTEYDLALLLDSLARMPGLTPEPLSKFERALAALDRQDRDRQVTSYPTEDAPSESEPLSMLDTPGLCAGDSMAEAARKTLRFHMLRMVANEAGTRAGIDSEALHDMRVATRRMRTAFYVFADAIDANATASYLKELKRAGRVLGRVRDLDVFREKTEAYLGAFTKSTPPDLTVLMRAWDAEYARARAKLLTYLDHGRYARFKDAFMHYLGIPWPSLPTRNARQSVAAVVPDLIAARLAEFYAARTRLDQANATLDDYHQTRIIAKYLRYTLEYFREVLGKDGEKAIAEVKALQNHLGALQDAVVASENLQNVVIWGTWRPPSEEQLQWASKPLNAPDVVAYLEFKQAEIRRLVRTFPDVWARYESADDYVFADANTVHQGPHLTALIASAIAALSS